jgi:hypothetical protein
LKNLRKLVLSHNYLTSSIPDALYQLSHLLHLKLNDCLLTGTLSSEISTLSQLRGLELQNNILNGSIPETLDRMSGLRLLYLDGNELSGTIPMALPGRVVDLRLSRNQLNGPIPSEIANSRRLRVLHLYSNGLTGKHIVALGPPRTLMRLPCLRLTTKRSIRITSSPGGNPDPQQSPQRSTPPRDVRAFHPSSLVRRRKLVDWTHSRHWKCHRPRIDLPVQEPAHWDDTALLWELELPSGLAAERQRPYG